MSKFIKIEFIFILLVIVYIILFGATFGIIFLFCIFQWVLSIFLFKKLHHKTNKSLFLKINKLIKYSIILFFVSFVIIQIILVNTMLQSTKEPKNNVDAVIILGAGLRGETLSNTLYERLQTGREFLLNNKDVPVIVSGGQGEGEDIPEAVAMGRFLIENGINKNRIYFDKTSTTTLENLSNSKSILKRNGLNGERTLIVTSNYHVYRALLIGNDLGLECIGLGSTSPFFITANYLIREYFAVVKTWVGILSKEYFTI